MGRRDSSYMGRDCLNGIWTTNISFCQIVLGVERNRFQTFTSSFGGPGKLKKSEK